MDGRARQYEAYDLGHRPVQFPRNLLIELKLRKRLRQRLITLDVDACGFGYFNDLLGYLASSFRSHSRSGIRSLLVLKSHGDLLVRLLFIRFCHGKPQSKVKGEPAHWPLYRSGRSH